MKTKFTSRALALLLTLTMVIGIMPMSVFAIDPEIALQLDSGWLTIDIILNGNLDADNIIKDMYFPEYGPNGAEIWWESDPYIFWDDGRLDSSDLDRELDRLGSDSAEVTITAYLYTYTPDWETEYEDIKEFVVTVRKLPPGDEKEVSDAAAKITFNSIRGANSMLASMVETHLNLMDTQDGLEVTWESSNTEVVSHGGVVTRPNVNTQVALTATVKKNDASDKSRIIITVLASTNAIREMVLFADEFNPGTENLTSHVNLPTMVIPSASSEDVTITWTTSDASIITSTGKITRPATGEQIVMASLTATFSVTGDRYTVVKTYPVSVLPQTEESLLAKEEAKITAEEKLALIPDASTITYETQTDALSKLSEAKSAVTDAIVAGWTDGEAASFISYANIASAENKISELPRDVTFSVLGAVFNPNTGVITYLEEDFVPKSKIKIDSKMTVIRMLSMMAELDPSFVIDARYQIYRINNVNGIINQYEWKYFIDGNMDHGRTSASTTKNYIPKHNEAITFVFLKQSYSYARPNYGDDFDIMGVPASKLDYVTPYGNERPVDIDFADPTLNAYNNLTDELVLVNNQSFENVTSDLYLPERAFNNLKIKWEISNTDVIAPDGKLINYLLLSGDKNITITGTIALAVGADDNNTGYPSNPNNFSLREQTFPTYTRTYNVSVKAPVLSNDARAVALAKENLSLGDTSLISEDMALPLTGPVGTSISWGSSNPAVLTDSGVITRPNHSSGNVTVTLIATISKGIESDTKEILVTVKALEAIGQEAIDSDWNALTFDAIRGQNTAEDNILYDLTLPSTGYEGSSIIWISVPNEAISSLGKVVRPQPGSSFLSVVLTATVSKDGLTNPKNFNLTLLPMSDKEAAIEQAIIAIAALPEAIDVNEVTRDTLLVKDLLKSANAAYNAAITAGATVGDISGYEKLLAVEAKMNILPKYVTISISGDIDGSAQADPGTELGYFYPKTKVRVPAGWNLMDLTTALVIMDGHGDNLEFGGGYLRAIYGKRECWMYGVVTDVDGAAMGASGYKLNHDDLIYWFQVYLQEPITGYENIAGRGEKFPLSHPYTVDLVADVADKTALADLISKSKSLNRADYRDYASWTNDWNNLEEAIAYAEKVNNMVDSIQYDIDTAYSALKKTITALEPVVPDIAALSVEIQKANALLEQDYKEGWTVFSEALRISKEVELSAYSNSKEINEALSDLSAAILALTPSGNNTDKAQLNAKIADAENLQQAVYTEISWRKLADALDSAKLIARTGNATQVEVDAALAILQTAISQLLTANPTAINDKIAVALEAIAESYIGTVEPWEVMAMAYAGRSGDINKSKILEDSQKTITSALSQSTDLQRTAIVLTSLGIDISRIEDGQGNIYDLLDIIVNDQRELQVNALAFALIALDSGNYVVPEGAKWTRNALIEALLEAQIEGKSWNWALGALAGDVDMTSMVITALSPYYAQSAVKTAVDNAFAWLKTQQKLYSNQVTFGEGSESIPNSGNANSVAMVILAATSIGKDPATEFVRAGWGPQFTIVTGLFNLYATPDYRFGFTDKAYSNILSTEQVFRALLTYDKFLNVGGMQSPYLFDTPTSGSIVDKNALIAKIAELGGIEKGDYNDDSWNDFQQALEATRDVVSESTLNQTQGIIDAALNNLMSAYRALSDIYLSFMEATTLPNKTIYMAGETLSLTGLVVTATYSDGSKEAVSGYTTTPAQGTVLSLTDTEIDVSYEGKQTSFNITVNEPQPVETITVTATVEKLTINDEYIVEPTQITVPKDSTAAYVVTKLLADKYPGITNPYHITGSVSSNFYLAGVYDPGYNGAVQNYLSQFDEGGQSGWMFCVNNIFSSVGASDVTLQDGNIMRWQYTKTGLGADIQNENQPADKDALTKKIAEINTLGTSESYGSAYTDALDALKTLTSTQASVNTALEALDGGTTPIIADKTALNSKITEAQGMLNSAQPGTAPGQYTQSAVDALEAAITTAQAVTDNADATQNEVDNAVTALNNAITAFNSAKVPESPSVAYQTALESALSWISSKITTPDVGSVGGEWAVLALARAGEASESWIAKYLQALDTALAAGSEVTKWTDYERVALALSALGIDAANYKGIDLTEAFKTYVATDARHNQDKTINADIYALIALNSKPYDGDTGKFVDAILAAEISGGGWGLFEFKDVDITAMAVQALAPYYNNRTDVKNSVDRALNWLKVQTVNDAEGNAQIIVALSALGMDSEEYVDSLLTYYDATTGGFLRKGQGDSMIVNQMTTEQASYALVAYDRFLNEENSLYNMSDAFPKEPEPGDPIKMKISYQVDNSGFKIIRKEFTVAPDLSEQYGYNDAFGGEKASALDAIVAAHIAVFGSDKATINSKLKLSHGDYGDFISCFMGDNAGNMKYYVNGESPWVGAPDQELLNGDIVELFAIRDPLYADQYGWFKRNDAKIENAYVETNADLSLNLQGNTWQGDEPVEGARIVTINAETGKFGGVLGVTDENGNVIIKFTAPGMYVVGAIEADGATPLMSPWLVLTVTGVNKTTLNTLITQVEALTASRYTTSTWNAVQTSLTAAKTVVANTGATQSEVDNARTALQAAVDNLQTTSGGTPTTNKVNVNFRLIGANQSSGDVNLSNGDYKGADYVTWIATKSYSMNEGETVYDLFVKAIGDAGLKAVGTDKNYVKSITAPKVLGGYVLGEFDNGQYSGWMYAINGKHPGYGLKEQVLKAGDVVIWHYVNDYRYEVSDWFGDSQYPSLGNSLTWNKWLEAADKSPTNNTTTNTTGGGGGTGTTTTTTTVTIEPAATVSNGKATSSVTDKQITDAVKEAKDKKADTVVIKPKLGSGMASSVSVDISKKAIEEVSKAGIGLQVETPGGSVTFYKAAQTAIVGAATGDNITIIIERVDKNTLTEEQKEVVGDHPVVDITVISGGTVISDMGDGKVKVSIPYELKAGEKAEYLVVWYINDDGEMTQIPCTYNANTKCVEFTVSHFSVYAVAYDAPEDAWVNPFTDVKSSDWFYEAVKYVNENGIMQGTGDSLFSPETNVTRAMLVTMLYRYAGEPEVTAANPFTDVAGGQWYTKAIIWASENGIVGGYGGGLFGPDDSITREQFAALLYRFAQQKGIAVSATTDLSAFSDADKVSDWAQTAVEWAVAKGLIQGRGENTFAPDGTATRAEAATLLMRFIEQILK